MPTLAELERDVARNAVDRLTRRAELAESAVDVLEKSHASLARQLAEEHRENERLRSALRSARCPGGGWNGMPDDIDPTVENCMGANACGCNLGDALKPQTGGHR